MAVGLLEQSHDLRVAVWLTSALLAQRAFSGLQEGLALIEGLMHRHWEALHPQLEDDDPTIRVNVLLALNDKTGLVRQAMATPLALASVTGRTSLRDILIANGEYTLSVTEAASPNLATIDSAFIEASYEQLSGTLEAVKRSDELAGRIEAMLSQYVGGWEGFPALRQALQRAAAEVAQRLDKHPGRGQATTHIEVARQPHMSQGNYNGALETRVDVLRALNHICDYYARHEPGSPIPLLLQRAKRLVDMDFVEIVTHLAPGGLDEVLRVAGLEKT